MSFKVGDEKVVHVTVTDEMVRKFAEVSGDFNPIHMDEEFAKNTRFGRRIAHGMLSAAFISRALAMELGPGGIYLGQKLKFLNPVYIDDQLTIHLKVTALRDDRGIGTIETTVTKANGDVVIKGEAMIMKGEMV